MKVVLFFLLVAVTVASCSGTDSEDATRDISFVDNERTSATVSNVVSFDIVPEELYGDWVLIGVGADSLGPGSAPYGEIFFAFRETGDMTVATDGVEELQSNLEEIPSPYKLDGNNICSNDLLFKMQFNGSCVEIIRLNEGRMSVAIQLEEGGIMYKHFVKVE